MRMWFSFLLIVVLSSALMVSCTTSEDDAESSEIEKELESEFGDLEDSESGESSDSEMEDSKDTSADENSQIADSELDFPSESDKKGKKSTPDEDEDFFAEDSSPPDSNSTTLAEKDLKQEMQTGAKGAASPTAIPPVAQAPYSDDVSPVIPPQPKDTGTTPVTSRETLPRVEDFENINPLPDIPKDDLGVSDPLVADVNPQLPSVRAAKEIVPVSKIGKDPFYRNERVMNTVYITRPGDDLGTISQKIFNEDRTSQLLADNPHISKGVEPGDKVYYNSINRPDDRKTILTYYEDSKFSPQYYTTKQGDDIHRIGQQLLGFADAWKEVWAVNEGLQTQSMLPGGLKLKYWTGNEVREATVAKTTPAPPTDAGPAEPKPQEPETPMNLGNNDMITAASTVNTDDPAISSPIITEAMPNTAGSAVPTPPAIKADDGMNMTIAGVALISIAVIVLVAIQIKNRRKDPGTMPPSLEFTKV